EEVMSHVVGVLGVAQKRQQVAADGLGIADEEAVAVAEGGPVRRDQVQVFGPLGRGGRRLIHGRPPPWTVQDDRRGGCARPRRKRRSRRSNRRAKTPVREDNWNGVR